MTLQLTGALALCVLLATTLAAEDNCGSMMRTTSRFRGTVRSIEPVGRRKVTVTPIDPVMSFVVAIEVINVEKGNAVPRVGQTLLFGIHSPSQTFESSEKIIGRTFDLETEWMECDGKFRRFLTLQRDSSGRAAEEFDGWLEVGHTYRAEATWSEGYLKLTKWLRLPMHHQGGIAWMNTDAYPSLTSNNAVRTVVFKIVSVDISQREQQLWLSIYHARIVEVR